MFFFFFHFSVCVWGVQQLQSLFFYLHRLHCYRISRTHIIHFLLFKFIAVATVVSLCYARNFRVIFLVFIKKKKKCLFVFHIFYRVEKLNERSQKWYDEFLSSEDKSLIYSYKFMKNYFKSSIFFRFVRYNSKEILYWNFSSSTFHQQVIWRTHDFIYLCLLMWNTEFFLRINIYSWNSWKNHVLCTFTLRSNCQSIIYISLRAKYFGQKISILIAWKFRSKIREKKRERKTINHFQVFFHRCAHLDTWFAIRIQYSTNGSVSRRLKGRE